MHKTEDETEDVKTLRESMKKWRINDDEDADEEADDDGWLKVL